ncbi:MAG TPA: glutamate-5-semialdehyde dehydrogenase [Opitutaceae bacterium]|jgi:glutamate-5-semialdehyde dehydrogenase
MSADTTLTDQITRIAESAREAALKLATAATAQKNDALYRLASALQSKAEPILSANRKDLEAARAAGLADAQIDRLTLNQARLELLAESVRQVADLKDPVGEVLEDWTRPNGLRIIKRRVPIGVIGVVFEARPNVTIDCAVLCLKAGNAAILRGGKEIFETNRAFAELIAAALKEAGLPETAVQLVPTTDRAALEVLLKLNHLIQCLIPRGGESLIRFVTEHSTIPVIKHYNGICFVYCDEAADPAMAEKILINAKLQRTGVCNAAEQLLVHAKAAPALLPRLGAALARAGAELRCDPRSALLLSTVYAPIKLATEADFRTEFLAPILAVRVVDSLEEAIAIINRDGSAHTDAIVTANEPAARRFLAAVDSAVVLWNASTRFNDGFEFGFGAEIGISTERLHARGPMGLPELCTYKYEVIGNGQVRQ